MSFSNKRVVITGGAGAMGRLLCHAFLQEGASLTIVDRAESMDMSEGMKFLRGDLSSYEGIQNVANKLAAENVDILINLAGFQYFGCLEQQDPENLMLLYMVNLIAPLMLSEAVLPGMKSRASGLILNVGSTFGSINFAHFVTYSSSKAGLKGFSEALRRELVNDGVNVTYIAPRAVNTPMNTEQVMQYAKMTKMNMVSPESVVEKMLQAIRGKKKDVYIGFSESMFVGINAVLPRVVDMALAGDDKKVKTLFDE